MTHRIAYWALANSPKTFIGLDPDRDTFLRHCNSGMLQTVMTCSSSAGLPFLRPPGATIRHHALTSACSSTHPRYRSLVLQPPNLQQWREHPFRRQALPEVSSPSDGSPLPGSLRWGGQCTGSLGGVVHGPSMPPEMQGNLGALKLPKPARGEMILRALPETQ